MNRNVKSYLVKGYLLTCVLLSIHCAIDQSQDDALQIKDNNLGGQMSIVGVGDATTPPVETGGAGGTLDAEPTTDSGSGKPPGDDAADSTKDTSVPPLDTGTTVDSDVKDVKETAIGEEQPPNDATDTLPPVTDPQKPGPFTATSETPGPLGYVLFYPKELGKDGIKHPIVSWGPGAVENAGFFLTMLNHLASHGFAVISYDATPAGQELVTAIDWMIAENDKTDSVFYKMLDTAKIAAGGHSAGSLATFVIGADSRLTTTMHISGGTFAPHTDINNLHAPALMICGEPGGDGLLMGDVANPNCQIDFDNATVPVFYGVTKGAAHMTPTELGDPAIRTHQLGAMVAWLRWQLMGDQNFREMFAGSCTLCSDPAWSSAVQRDL